MKKVLKIQIVEDEFIIAMDLRSTLENLGYIVSGISSSFEEAILDIQQNKPDLVLLDICLSGDKTGIDIANLLKYKYQIPFIYSSCLTDPSTIKGARETNPLGYIVKPFHPNTVYTALEMAFGHIEQMNKSKFIFLPYGSSKIKVEIESIIYAAALGGYSKIVLPENTIVLRKTLKEVTEELLNRSCFVRAHKSYLINFKAIRAKTGTHLTMLNGQVLPIGRSYASSLKCL